MDRCWVAENFIQLNSSRTKLNDQVVEFIAAQKS